MTPEPRDGDFAAAFRTRFKREYGFDLTGRDLVIDDVRVRGVANSSLLRRIPIQAVEVSDDGGGGGGEKTSCLPEPDSTTSVYFEGGWRETPVYLLEQLLAGMVMEGPAIVMNGTSTCIVEPQCVAEVTAYGDLKIEVNFSGSSFSESESKSKSPYDSSAGPDAVQLSIFNNRFMGIAEQMGRTLQRTSVSTNIKERLDFSCALFGPDGGLVANAPHVPVHLGAMSSTVQWQLAHWGLEGLAEGDVLVTNHPQAGGSHLPDITVVTPVFREGKIVFLVASRGHHADVGGITPGSMPPFSRSIADEGAAIKAFKLVSGGVFQEDGIELLLTRPETGSPGTRKLADNISDLKAQVAANQRGILLINELIDEYGLEEVQAYMGYVQENAELAVRDMLREAAERLLLLLLQTPRCARFANNNSTNRTTTTRNRGKKGEGKGEARAQVQAGGDGDIEQDNDNGVGDIVTLVAEDKMDDGSTIRLRLTLDRREGSAVFDFTGTSDEVYGNWNAPPAVTSAAVIYCVRCLVNQEIPLNQGCLKPIEIIVPEGTFLSPSENAAVVGGNVLTSQRVTDVCLAAFTACADSQGCMNNLTFGDESFGYYETIGGGAGAGPGWDGASGVQCHMTNTRITDPEILERRYPVVLRRFSIRPGSGGDGEFRGGDGIIREIEFLRPITVSVLTERRVMSPNGAAGGECGAVGVNTLISASGPRINLGGKNTVQVAPGDVLQILTPGGGGFGSAGGND